MTIHSGLSLSLIMTYNMHVQKHSILTIYSGLSLSLSRYDVQHACTETIDTDDIIGPISLSLVMTYNMHVQKHSILTIYSGLSISVSRYDVHHACAEAIDTGNTFGALSLSLWRATCINRNTRYWQYIRAYLRLVMSYYMHVQKHSTQTLYSVLSLSLSLSRYDVQHACTETLDTDNIFGPLSLSSYDVQHACTKTIDTENIIGPISLFIVMKYNMHVHKHSILTIHSGLSLSLIMTATCI